jgi:hypothetical protein
MGGGIMRRGVTGQSPVPKRFKEFDFNHLTLKTLAFAPSPKEFKEFDFNMKTGRLFDIPLYAFGELAGIVADGL